MTEAEFSRLAAAGHNRIPAIADASADPHAPPAGYEHGHKMLQNFIEGK